MTFNCTSCGQCCKRLGEILEAYQNMPSNQILKLAADDFPHRAIDGVCEKLVDNQCSIYNDRPLLCNIKGLYEKYPMLASSEKDWYLANMLACNAMISQAKLPKKFHIKKAFNLHKPTI